MFRGSGGSWEIRMRMIDVMRYCHDIESKNINNKYKGYVNWVIKNMMDIYRVR
jgi:hypothetical protein